MMEIKIYQINLDRDEEGVAFESMDMLERYQHTKEINPEIYDKVFEGTVEARDLEDVFRIFNIDHPDGYRGRSLSVSDIVETIDSPNGESGPQDGESDHTGIVEKVENGIVYTVEGNSGDSCRQCQRAVGNYEILGYGVLIP